MPHAFDPVAVEFVRQAAFSPAFCDYLKDLLTRLVSIDTAGSGPLPQLTAQESRIFDILEREISSADPAAVVRRVAIDPAIAADADYTVSQYAINPDGPARRWKHRPPVRLCLMLTSTLFRRGLTPVSTANACSAGERATTRPKSRCSSHRSN